MNDLHKAAEQALKQLQRDDIYLGHRSKTRTDAITALRQAIDLQTAIEQGTKAWADVPNATEWVEELRGNVDKVDMSEKRVHKTDKSIHELDLEAPLTINGVPLYPKKEWVGLTDEEVKYLISHFDWRAPKEQFVSVIEAKLKEKNA